MNRPTRVLVRADAGARIGAGHVLRAISLVEELVERGAEAIFATCTLPAELRSRVARTGSRHVDLGPLTGAGTAAGDGAWPASSQHDDLHLIEQGCGTPAEFDITIVDHYGLDLTWEARARSFGGRVVVIDDLADRAHDCDVLVDQNWYGPHTAARYRALVPEGCLQLLGPRYAILQPDYRRLRANRRPVRWPPQEICVSYGGTDPTGESAKVLEALADPLFAHLEVEVAVGSPHAATNDLRSLVEARDRTQLHVALPTLAPLLASADLSLGASGAATWERLCLGVPGLVTTTSDRQAGVTAAFAEAGITHWIGSADEATPHRYREALVQRLAEPLGDVLPLVDGFGAPRIAEALLPSPATALALRPATEADLPTFLGDDPGTAAEGRCSLDGPALWRSRAAEVRELLNGSSARVLVVELAGVPVGGVVIHPGPSSEISLHDAVRGRDLPGLTDLVRRDGGGDPGR
jgi:UDP-2,4-diacetamido-2,4,6-trideoxy-beta-L-altropyranose hydrolase